MQPLLLLATGGITLTLGDIIVRQWLATNDGKTYVLGMAFAAVLRLESGP
jgi:hypothetical protein